MKVPNLNGGYILLAMVAGGLLGWCAVWLAARSAGVVTRITPAEESS